MGMLGLTLIFVGAVLFINGMGGLKRADDRSMAVFNFLAGFLFLFAALLSLARAEATQDYYGVAGILLFAFTYLYIAASLWFDLDLRGLGWYCFFVALTTIPYFTLNYQAGEYRLGTMWLAWARCGTCSTWPTCRVKTSARRCLMPRLPSPSSPAGYRVC